MAKIITVSNHKGGCGKTSTAAALAQLAIEPPFMKNGKVLAIDLDPLGSLSNLLKADMEALTSYDLITGTATALECIQKRGWLHVIPASQDLATLESSRGSARRLAKALEPIKENYDLIIIDTPTAAGEAQYNAMQASTAVIIPLQATSDDLQGLYTTAEQVQQFQESNKELSFIGCICTRYKSRPSKVQRIIHDNLMDAAEELAITFLGDIREGNALQEAHATHTSLAEYYKSNPTLDYRSIVDKIIYDI